MPPKSRSPLQLNFPTRKTCLLCQIHRPSILPQPLLHHPNPPPTFSTSNPRLGRAGHKNDSSKGKQTSNTPSSPYSSSSKGVSTQPAGGESPPSDVLDFSRLDAAHENLVTQLRTDLVKLKPGGLDLDTVEAVRVSFKPVRQKFERRDDRILEWGKEREREKERVKNEVIRVRDLAQVFVRGRVCVVMVGEKEHVKPLLSSLQSSLSLPAPPTQQPNNPLEIHIPIPPTTGESRASAQLAAKQLGEKTIEKWSEARSTERKRMRASGPRISRDVISKVDARLTKMQEKVVWEIKGLVENAKRRLGGG